MTGTDRYLNLLWKPLTLRHCGPVITFVLIAGNVNTIAILSHLTSSHISHHLTSHISHHISNISHLTSIKLQVLVLVLVCQDRSSTFCYNWSRCSWLVQNYTFNASFQRSPGVRSAGWELEISFLSLIILVFSTSFSTIRFDIGIGHNYCFDKIISFICWLEFLRAFWSDSFVQCKRKGQIHV